MIRLATPEDAKAIARVHVETWQAAYAHVFPRERLLALSIEDRAEAWRSRTPLLYEVDAQIVGFIDVGPSRDDADGEVYAIYVLPSRWGTGAGRALMQAGEERLLELGHEQASLWVLEDNPRARRFYETAGWSTDGTTRPIEIFDIQVPEIRYHKRLG